MLWLRTLAGVERPDAATLAGLHRNVIYKSEAAEHDNPEANTSRAIARLFDVSLDWLLVGDAPCIRTAPELDPAREEHHEAIASHVRAAVAAARESQRPAAPVEVVTAVAEG